MISVYVWVSMYVAQFARFKNVTATKTFRFTELHKKAASDLFFLQL